MVKKPTRLRVSLLQFSSSQGQPLLTLNKVHRLVKHLDYRADLLVTPEMWPTGFILGEKQRLQRENDLCLDYFKSLAVERKVYVISSMLETYGGQYFNSAFLINPHGKIQKKYRKIHLFKLSQEHKKFNPGNEVVVAEVKGVALGVAICYDLRFPEVFRKMLKWNVEVIAIPAAWPKPRLDHFNTLLKARAIENQAYVLGVNKVGQSLHGEVYAGNSSVYDPWGVCLGKLGTGLEVLNCELNLNRLRKIREEFPALKDRRLW